MTRCERLRKLLRDGRWHSMVAVMSAGGWRYSARLYDIGYGKDGGRPMLHEVKRDKRGCFWYRRGGLK